MVMLASGIWEHSLEGILYGLSFNVGYPYRCRSFVILGIEARDLYGHTGMSACWKRVGGRIENIAAEANPLLGGNLLQKFNCRLRWLRCDGRFEVLCP